LARDVTRVLGLAVLAVASIGCNDVSLPSTPSTTLPTVIAPAQWTSPAPTTAVWLYYAFPTRAQFGVGSGFSFSVLAIHADGVYEPLGTPEATWTSSNPAIVRITGTSASTLQAVGVGIATITVTARGFSDSATVEIVNSSASSTYPRLTVNPLGGPTGAGETRDARLVFSESPTNFREVQAEADWSSSDPRVATVAAGRVTAVGQGATEISASYRGYSDRFRLSVHQADDRASIFTLGSGDVPAGVPYTWAQDWGLRIISEPTGTFFFALVDQNNVVLTPAPWPSAIAYKPGGIKTFATTITSPPGTTRVCSQVMLVMPSGVRKSFSGTCRNVR
jgi:hypothetical protein